MNIGILGSGDVGRRLGDGFIELGHNVKIGSRDPNKGDIARWVSSHGANERRASSGTFSEAASFAELIVLATSWDGTPNAIKIADQKNFDGKVVIDKENCNREDSNSIWLGNSRYRRSRKLPSSRTTCYALDYLITLELTMEITPLNC
jgi:predicted dinucleotide-binding enzyme